MTPRVLFITAPEEDYLADSLFLGLRALLGANAIDHPRKDCLYDTVTAARRQMLYGRGFTLYAGLPDIAVDRTDVDTQLADRRFDVVIFSSIHRVFERFIALRPLLDKVRVAVLDGEDNPVLFPYSSKYWRRPGLWFLPRVHRRFLYFKREWTPQTVDSRWYHLVPRAVSTRLRPPPNLRPIAFSMPDDKILAADASFEKRRLFPSHVVDGELAARLGTSAAYRFDTEGEYYADLRAARFGVTTKRSGWDCLRHYEIAANGAVPCFRGLDTKPETCAPHGLNDDNCVTYSSADDLIARVQAMSEAEYVAKRRAALVWARRNSTRTRARDVLGALGYSLEQQ